MSAPLPVPAHRLPDVCTEMFAFVLQLGQTADPGEGEQLRVRVNRMLTEIHQRGRELGVSEEGLAQARYALVALVDEVVLTSQWPLKGAWLGRPLQMEHFNSFAAGEEFFTRLDAVRAGSDPHKVDILEVFATCLCLGFKGKHGGVQGIETIRRLLQALIGEIQAAQRTSGPSQSVAVSARDQAIGRSRRRSNPDDLSPAWQPPSQSLAMPKDLPVRPIIAAALALVVIVYGVLVGWLGQSASAVVDGLGG